MPGTTIRTNTKSREGREVPNRGHLSSIWTLKVKGPTPETVANFSNKHIDRKMQEEFSIVL